MSQALDAKLSCFIVIKLFCKTGQKSLQEIIKDLFRERKKATMETAETRKARLQCDSGKVFLSTQKKPN